MNYVLAQTGALSGLDWGIVGVGALLLFVISYVFGREERDTNDFFLGGRRVPPAIACMSFVATEISALISVATKDIHAIAGGTRRPPRKKSLVSLSSRPKT